MKPTDEQIREFWEWCGINTQHDFGPCGFDGMKACIKCNVLSPPQSFYKYCYTPPIDLNNLFEYAVPLAVKGIRVEQECDEELAYAILFKKWLQKGYDADALFWALDEVRNDRMSQGE